MLLLTIQFTPATTVVAEVNRAPAFARATATRRVPRNALVGSNVSTAVRAEDPDGDDLTYTLTGSGDEEWFTVVGTSGQLRVAKPLEKQVGESYQLTLTADDGKGGTGQVAVTVKVAEANRAPAFESATATRRVPRNALVGHKLRPAVRAEDPDGDDLTYTLTGSGDEEWFTVVGTNGQLQVAKPLEKQAGESYQLTLTADDGKGGTGQVAVTVEVVNRAPAFESATATRRVPRNALVGSNVGRAVRAEDPDGDDLTYTLTGSGDEEWFTVVGTSGQLRVAKPLEKQVGESYQLMLTADDGKGGTGQVAVTVEVVNRAPAFARATATRRVSRNALVGSNVSTAVRAEDPDGDDLTYTLTGSGDEEWFTVVGTSGQLRVAKPLEKQVGESYQLTLTADDGKGGTGQVAVTVKVVEANRAPAFESATATRHVPRNALVGHKLRPAVRAEDPDGDDLTYTLTGSGDEEWFTVVGTSGQLQVAKPLEKQVGESYQLTLTADDGKGGTGQVAVTVEVVNRAPAFESATATRRVPRNALVGSNVGPAVRAEDPDGDDLTYTLTGSGDEEWFTVVGTSGQLRVAKPLEKQVGESYQLMLTADDGKGGTGQVAVTVEVVNRAPAFESATATRRVPRNALVGSNVGRAVRAEDPDGDDLTYTLTGSGDEEWFTVVGTSGQLRVAKPLEKQVGESYQLTLTADDGKGGTGQVAVTVKVVEANRAPAFESATATRRVPRNALVGHKLRPAVRAEDPDGDDLTYTLTGSGDEEWFTVVGTNGQLQVAKPLEKQAGESYQLTLTADDGKGGTGQVAVTVEVVNRAPAFESATATRRVPRNALVGSNVGRAVRAEDPDGDDLTYTLTGSGDEEWFTVVGTSGQLRVAKPLEKQVGESYQLMLTADDGKGGTGQVAVTVEVVNRAPAFESATATRRVPRNALVGSNVGSAVRAEDPDGDDLTYTLTGSGDEEWFTVVGTSGQLRVAKPLEKQVGESYQLTLTADDGKGGTGQVAVTVKVAEANRAPAFESATATRHVPRNALVGHKLRPAVRAEDPDGDDLTYTLTGSGDEEWFTVVGTNGQLQVAKPLEKQAGESYQLTLTADDGKGGTGQVAVTVEVVNRAPAFESATATRRVPRNALVGSNVGSAVRAEDPDGDDLTYTLTGSGDEEWFTVVGTSGQLRVAKPLEKQAGESYQLMLTADDGKGGTGQVAVTVEVVNRAPAFESATATRRVPRNALVGSNVGSAVRAEDPDGDDLTYTLTGSGDEEWFTVVETSGQLRVAKPLEKQVGESYQLTLTADDGKGGTGQVAVTVRVGKSREMNRAPAFESATATRHVPRNALVGHKLRPAVRAEDPDGDDLTYTLTGSGDEEWFTVVGTNGQLQVAKPLEKQAGESYQLTLTADDGKGGTGQVAVTVEVVNRAPAFESATATRRVPRNALVGSNVGPAVRAEDPDGDDLTYTLTGSGDEEWFTVVGTSGQLRVAKPLEKQVGESYQLTLTADDGKGGTGQVAVTVEVVNRAPAFARATATRRVSRNALVGSNVSPAVRAEDPDGDDLTYTLTGSGDEEWFTVVGTSGQLRVAKPLEKQVGESYQLTLTADDGKGGTGQVAVTVKVVEANRAPAFESATATRRVPRNALVGHKLRPAVRAEDPDGDDLTYTLTGSGDEEWFTVVGTSGQLQVAKPLEKQAGESYQLTLTADDGKGGTGQVAVTVEVVNRAPAFESATATRRVPRNALVGSNVGPAVRAEDPDDDDLTYTLTGSGDEEWFTVVGTSGQLRVAKPLEKQVGESYQLTLTADDGKGGTGQVAVTVEVVNRAPAFARATATRRVSRNALVGSNVSTAVRAEDPDGDDLTYTLTGSGDEEWFTVVGTSGQLRVAKPLEKQVGESYQLTLTADDGKGGTGQVAVTVKVVEANRAPAFESATATRRVPRNALVGHKLRPAVRAEDPDGDDLTYTLTGSGDEEWFTVVGTSGQLQVAKPLEKQAGESYQLTLTADDGKGGTGQVAVTVEVVNRAPAFESATATRRVPRNALVGSNVGPAVRAEDPDGDDLTYTLTGSGDEEWFTVVGTSGQLRVAKPLEKQVGESYQLTLTADDGKGGTGQVAVTVEVVNRAPAFARATATRRVSRNALVGSNVSTAVRAEDPDGDDLTYTLTGSGDEEWFTVVGTSGQLRVAKPLEKQVGESYQLTLTADDGKGGTGQVAVTVKVVEANRAPAFESATATRRVPRNALVGHKLRPAVRAEDPDGDDLTYTLTGSGDEEWFTVVGTSGQLQVAKPLEKQAGESYQLTLTADDGKGGTGQVAVTVEVVNRAPAFESATATRRVPRNALVGSNVGPAVRAEDPDDDDLTYTLTGSGDEEWFTVVGTSGQLRVAKPLEKQVGESYQLTLTADDGKGGTGQVAVTVEVVNRAPAFARATATRRVSRNALVGSNVSTAVRAEDPDGDDLTYTLTGSGDEEWFTVVGTSGQLRVAKPLEKQVGESYQLTLTADDGKGGTGQVAVTVKVVEANRAPAFESATATRHVPRNALVGHKLRPAVRAEDPDGDDLTYTLTGSGDEEWFTVVGTNGQLQVAKPLEKQAGESYQLTLTADDGKGGTGQVAVTVEVSQDPFSYKLLHVWQGDEISPTIDANKGKISFSVPIEAQVSELTVEVESDQYREVYDVRITLDVEDNTNSPSAFPAVDTAMRDVSKIPLDRQSSPLAKKAAPRSVLQPRSQAYSGSPRGDPVKAVQAGTLSSYTIIGIDKDFFDISADGILTLKNKVNDEKRNYSVTVITTDSNGNRFDHNVTVVIVQVGSTFVAEVITGGREKEVLDAPSMAIWTDKLTYLPGDRMQLYLDIDPRRQEQDYAVFIYRTELSTGERAWLDIRGQPASFSTKVIDIHGQSEPALWPRRLRRISKQLVWEGLVPEAGHWQFVAELRNKSGTYTFKRAYARFMLAGGGQVMVAREGGERRIEVDERWLGNMIHVLQGRLLVPHGVTLQIEAGAHILAKEGAAIIILDGGRIVARGRREKPIVMTCASPIGERVPGCWGGLEIRAKKSTELGQVSSGELRYVRVEFAGGWPEGAGPAVDLLEVSEATVLEHVQVHASLGQGFRFRGGNVVCYRCVASNTGQAGILWSDNFNGLLQDLYVQQEDPAASGVRGIAGNKQGVHARIYNATLLGRHDSSGKGSASGIELVGANAILEAKNIIVSGFGGYGIMAEAGGAKQFRRNSAISFIFGSNWRGTVNRSISTRMRIPIHLPQLLTMRPQPNPDPRPRIKSRALVPEAAVPVSAESSHAREELHVGAFAYNNWLEQWTWFGGEEQYRAQ